LETVRQYARDSLRDSGETEIYRILHLSYFEQQAGEIPTALTSPPSEDWLDQMEAEQDNLRAALEWSLSEADKIESALRLSTVLGWFFRTRGHLSEGRQWLSRALQLRCDSPPRLRAEALECAGRMAYDQCDFVAAMHFWVESAAKYQESGDFSQWACML